MAPRRLGLEARADRRVAFAPSIRESRSPSSFLVGEIFDTRYLRVTLDIEWLAQMCHTHDSKRVGGTPAEWIQDSCHRPLPRNSYVVRVHIKPAVILRK